MDTLIAVQYPVLREGITNILSEDAEIVIKDVVQNRNELFSLSVDGDCILILDLNLVNLKGRKIVEKLVEKYSELDILVVGEDKRQDNVKEIMQSKASGYFSKKQSGSELIKAIKKIHQGDIYLSDEAIGMLYNKVGDETEKKIASVELTDRETQVLELICRELTNREIANKLSISVRTVDAHRRNLLQKTGAKNTAGLVKYGIKHQIYELP